MLKDKVAKLSLSAGQAYYGGTLIFKEKEVTDLNAEPKELSSCTHIISRARGEKDDGCRDGTGVAKRAQKTKQINVFAPEATDKEITAVLTALKASKDQLQYIPIQG